MASLEQRVAELEREVADEKARTWLIASSVVTLLRPGKLLDPQARYLIDQINASLRDYRGRP